MEYPTTAPPSYFCDYVIHQHVTCKCEDTDFQVPNLSAHQQCLPTNVIFSMTIARNVSSYQRRKISTISLSFSANAQVTQLLLGATGIHMFIYRLVKWDKATK